MERLSLSAHTLFADLLQRCLDASFIAQLPENGNFTRVKKDGRAYWYYRGYDVGADVPATEQKRWQKYVGPADDPEINNRVAEFKRIRDSFRERRRLVRALIGMGLPQPDRFAGDVVEILWKAGLFRLRAVLVGTVAFQTYGGLLGVRLPAAEIMTGDVDIAQFHSVSKLVEDSLPPILETLHQVDETFRELPHQSDSRIATVFVNRSDFRVEFLTPNVSKDEYGGRPPRMSALGGASAQPLRFLDFLIYRPVNSVLLHKGGVPVLVPAPERYAVHKLIIAEERRSDARSAVKVRKDIAQAELLIEALTMTGNAFDLGSSWTEAWDRGVGWQRRLKAGSTRLSRKAASELADAVRTSAETEGKSFDAYGFGDVRRRRPALPANGR